MKKVIKLLPIFGLLLLAGVVSGQSDDLLSSFQNIKEISFVDIAVPTVVEVTFREGELKNFNVAIFGEKEGGFLPSAVIPHTSTNPVSIDITSNSSNESSYMDDDNYSTYAEFPATEGSVREAQIVISGQELITSSSLAISLDRYVALPVSISIKSDGKVVVSKTKMSSSGITFPKTTGKKWEIFLGYVQPLRISELNLIEDSPDSGKNFGVRFLAQPDSSYKIYYNPDRSAYIPVGEAPNLRDNRGLLTLGYFSGSQNDKYVPADVDADGITDIIDNCVNVSNPDQKDVDGNERGDACDDWDRDGIINSVDNCVNDPNRSQADIDNDGIGDTCDEEESRITEKYPWLPWLGLGTVAVVLIVMFSFAFREFRKKENDAEVEVDQP